MCTDCNTWRCFAPQQLGWAEHKHHLPLELAPAMQDDHGRLQHATPNPAVCQANQRPAGAPSVEGWNQHSKTGHCWQGHGRQNCEPNQQTSAE